MPQLLWISPFSLHDRALAPARQLLQMVRALKMMQPQLQISVLCPTIFSSTDPHAIDLSVRQEVLQIQGNTILLDHGVQFLYMKTHSTDFGAMATIEQRNFVNELVPLFHSLKPDVVVVHNCDLLSLCALNQAKLCGLSTAFILHDFIPSYFHFADVDLILKIAAIGILVSVLNQVLSRSGRDEQATMTTLAGLVVVLMMVVQQISSLFTLVKDLFGL